MGEREKSEVQYVPSKFHEAFHLCFENMLLPEIHEFLDRLYSEDKWTGKQLRELRKEIMEGKRWTKKLK